MSRTTANWLNNGNIASRKSQCLGTIAMRTMPLSGDGEHPNRFCPSWTDPGSVSYSANEEAKALTEYLERDGVEGPLEGLGLVVLCRKGSH